MSRILNFLIVLMLICSVNAGLAFAEKNNNEVQLNSNEVVVVVNGVVCTFCAQGVNKKLSKLDFVDGSKYKKGVFVDIENQKVTMAVKPGADFDLEEVLKRVESGGYEPVTVHTNLNGEGIKVIKLKEG